MFNEPITPIESAEIAKLKKVFQEIYNPILVDFLREQQRGSSCCSFFATKTDFSKLEAGEPKVDLNLEKQASPKKWWPYFAGGGVALMGIGSGFLFYDSADSGKEFLRKQIASLFAKSSWTGKWFFERAWDGVSGFLPYASVATNGGLNAQIWLLLARDIYESTRRTPVEQEITGDLGVVVPLASVAVGLFASIPSTFLSLINATSKSNQLLVYLAALLNFAVNLYGARIILSKLKSERLDPTQNYYSKEQQAAFKKFRLALAEVTTLKVQTLLIEVSKKGSSVGHVKDFAASLQDKFFEDFLSIEKKTGNTEQEILRRCACFSPAANKVINGTINGGKIIFSTTLVISTLILFATEINLAFQAGSDVASKFFENPVIKKICGSLCAFLVGLSIGGYFTSALKDIFQKIWNRNEDIVDIKKPAVFIAAASVIVLVGAVSGVSSAYGATVAWPKALKLLGLEEYIDKIVPLFEATNFFAASATNTIFVYDLLLFVLKLYVKTLGNNPEQKLLLELAQGLDHSNSVLIDSTCLFNHRLLLEAHGEQLVNLVEDSTAKSVLGALKCNTNLLGTIQDDLAIKKEDENIGLMAQAYSHM